MRLTTFIYTLNDPVTGQVRYVGKSDCPQRRFEEHLSYSKLPKTHCACWIRKVMDGGYTPILNIVDEIPVSLWETIEQDYIRVFKALRIPLTNICEGGESPPDCTGRMCSLEHRRKIAAVKTGLKLSNEVKAKLRLKSIGNKRCVGRVLSDETKAKIGLASAKRRHSVATRMKMSASHSGSRNSMFGMSGPLAPNYGRKMSDEARRKIGNAHRGKVMSLEAREKCRISKLGKRMSPEARENMRQGQLNRWRKVKELNHTCGYGY